MTGVFWIGTDIQKNDITMIAAAGYIDDVYAEINIALGKDFPYIVRVVNDSYIESTYLGITELDTISFSKVSDILLYYHISLIKTLNHNLPKIWKIHLMSWIKAGLLIDRRNSTLRKDLVEVVVNSKKILNVERWGLEFLLEMTAVQSKTDRELSLVDMSKIYSLWLNTTTIYDISSIIELIPARLETCVPLLIKNNQLSETYNLIADSLHLHE